MIQMQFTHKLFKILGQIYKGKNPKFESSISFIHNPFSTWQFCEYL